jgi:hypothetical protein
MPCPFGRNIFLKLQGEEIVVESLFVPMWNILVAHISIG